MDFFIYSRGAIERVAPHDTPHLLVSITSHPSDQARLAPGPACLGLLRLSFVDADQPSEAHPEETLFTPAQAAAIWDLLAAHPGAVRVVVHCDAGMCRSPAVAAALSKVLCGEDEDFFRRYRPNRRVYRLLLEEAHARGLLGA